MAKRRATATDQVERITRMVAELSRVGLVGDGDLSVDQAAELLGTTRNQVLKDLVVLSEAAEDPGACGLSSLLVYQEGDCIGVSSRGAFRRPIRLTAEELLALKVALATETADLTPGLRALVELDPGEALPVETVPFLRGGEAAIVDLFRTAVLEQRKVRIEYFAERETTSTERVIHPYEIIDARGRFYIAGWCEMRNDWRLRFRADRIVNAELLAETFERRDDAPLIEAREQLFVAPAADEVDEVTVRFSPNIARWIRERYPSAEDAADGSVTVTLLVAQPEWLVNNVLQYGVDAEVMGPPVYRAAVRRAVAG
jgi:predicted DNA-binding transcriptional regulator YafY